MSLVFASVQEWIAAAEWIIAAAFRLALLLSRAYDNKQCNDRGLRFLWIR